MIQAEVADILGWTPEMISLIEARKRYPSLDSVPALAVALGLDAFELGCVLMREKMPHFLAVLQPRIAAKPTPPSSAGSQPAMTETIQ
jgi:transcriptional regulator with XRE-family HTH domain